MLRRLPSKSLRVKNLKISNKQLQIEQLVKLDNRNVLLLNVFTLMSKYRYHVNKYARVYQMNDVDAQKYRYKPYSYPMTYMVRLN